MSNTSVMGKCISKSSRQMVLVRWRCIPSRRGELVWPLAIAMMILSRNRKIGAVDCQVSLLVPLLAPCPQDQFIQANPHRKTEIKRKDHERPHSAEDKVLSRGQLLGCRERAVGHEQWLCYLQPFPSFPKLNCNYKRRYFLTVSHRSIELWTLGYGCH